MKHDKIILDPCCGGKMFWFDKNNPDVEFCDIRDFETTLCDGRKFEVKPDMKADFTNLPFTDGAFKLIVFDPPHLTRNVGNSKFQKMYGSLDSKVVTGYQQIKYGAQYGDWKETIDEGFKECFRVLGDSGVLIFKWNETDIKVSEILPLSPYKPLFGHKSGKASRTHWICFMKIENLRRINYGM